MHNALYLFAGPSLFGTRFQHLQNQADSDAKNGVYWRAPAGRGDITKLLEEVSKPGAIALVDGTFHAYPSVAHRELRDAIDAGWFVYGLCSMGAIRACELNHHGMIPFGKVARMFMHSPDMADDEVALMHGTEAPYYPLSEPMVHIREFLHSCRAARLLEQEEHDRVVASMRERWYAHRTLDELSSALATFVPSPRRETVLARMEHFDPYRLKQQDLTSFLTARTWEYAPSLA